MEIKSYKSNIESIHEIQAFVKQQLSRISNDQSRLLKIDLLIEEIVVNIVKYGCKGIKHGCIDIGIDLSGEDSILEISDNGIAFNPLEQKTPDISLGIKNRRPGGLGIFLVKQIAKKIDYARQNNKNIIRLCLDL